MIPLKGKAGTNMIRLDRIKGRYIVWMIILDSLPKAKAFNLFYSTNKVFRKSALEQKELAY